MSFTHSSPSLPDMATIKHHDGHKTPPILTPGTLSPAILAQLIQYFNSYFNKCKIDNADKVKNILLSFQDIKIKNCINNNIEVLQGADYTFNTFTSELRKHFLNPHWEHSIVRTVVNSQITSTESFSTFANRVMEGNNLLIGTTSRLYSTALRAKLEINMSGYLADKIARLRPTDKQRILDIEIFEDWLAEITLLDKEITADLKRIADFASEHIAKKQRTENHYNLYPQHQQPPHNPHNPQASFSPPLSRTNAITPSFNHTLTSQNNSNLFHGGYRGSNNLRTTKCLRCPKLLPSEFELLEKHNGCRKCRRFYINHRAYDCPNEFPNPDTYTTLTEEMALKAMSSAAIASTYNAHMPSSTINTPFIPQSTYSAQPTCYVEEVPNDSSSNHVQTSVAAVLPSASSTPFVLGTGDSDTESSNSTVSPISVPHYIWHANVHGVSEFPTPVDCLLDNGAHLVLIRPETVADLGLKIRKLHKPQLATVAIKSKRHTFHLFDYVHLTFSSLNNAWTSQPVRALIAADLCTNILLGLPFLKHNKIVIDHDSDTVIDKITGFDLLNENKISPLLHPPKPRVSPKQKRDNILLIQRQVLEELKWRCTNVVLFLNKIMYSNQFNPLIT